MPHPPVSTIVALSVEAVELPHPLGEIRPAGLKQHVIVVVHEAVGVAAPRAATDHVAEQGEKLRAVLLICHNILSRIAAAGHVVDSPRKLQT
jgi:hypothetical protein